MKTCRKLTKCGTVSLLGRRSAMETLLMKVRDYSREYAVGRNCEKEARNGGRYLKTLIEVCSLTQKPIETSTQSYSERLTVCSISAEKIIATRVMHYRRDNWIDSGYKRSGYSLKEQKRTWKTCVIYNRSCSRVGSPIVWSGGGGLLNANIECR